MIARMTIKHRNAGSWFRYWQRVAATAIVLLLPLSAQAALGSSGTVIALVGGMVLDGTGAPPIHHATVVIEGNRITAIGPSGEITIPAGAKIINTSGRTVMPGLIDAHVHLVILGHGDYTRWMPWIAKNGLMEKAMEISAKELLNAGITSAIDLGAPLKEIIDVRDRINKGEIPGPRMSVSGPWITKTPVR